MARLSLKGFPGCFRSWWAQLVCGRKALPYPQAACIVKGDRSMSPANLQDSAKASLLETWEHTLPYRVLVEELKVRRPDMAALKDENKLKVKLEDIDRACKQVNEAREALPPLPQEEVEIRSKLDKNALSLFDQAKETLSAAADNTQLKEAITRLRQSLKDLDAGNDPGNEARTAREAYLTKIERYYSALGRYRSALKNRAKEEVWFKTHLHNAGLNALCFSGGGIRSASFGLGVFLELAKDSSKCAPLQRDKAPGLAGQLDYISTVSGGGYTGSWLTAWTSRHPDGFAGVVRDLAEPSATSTDPEVDQIRHLRDYTSYLAPHVGLFSVDSWTLAAIAIRNLLLNWTILLPVFALALLVPLFSSFLFSILAACSNKVTLWILLLIAVAGAAQALLYITRHLPSSAADKPVPAKIHFWWGAWVPLLISAWSISGYWLATNKQSPDTWKAATGHLFLWLLGLALLAESFLACGAWKSKGASLLKNFRKKLIFVAVVNSAFVALLLWFMATQLGAALAENGKNYKLFTSFAVPLVWIVFMLAVVVMNGMSSDIDPEENREWWSRSGAVMLIGTAVWVVAHILVLYSGDIAKAADTVFRGKLPGTATISLIAAVLGVVASWLGFSPATPSAHTKVDTEKLKKAGKFLSKRELLVPALGVLFFLVLGIALANLNTAIMCWIANRWFCAKPWKEFAAAGLEALALLLIVFPANRLVNVNTFSLHAMYRMRLIRSYLGASNLTRRPNPFTNFDPSDNMAMRDAPCWPNAPLHIVNMALNLVASTKLAWQQRKAESFTVSALHSGSHRVGYQRTAEYAGDRGITLGTAMAISGAAASPNMGYHSSPVLTLVMALFNARLGWWLPNPGDAGEGFWQENSPVYSVKPLLYESFGHTTDTQKWIYLSDGGHFENLGLYEMVMRRCKYIIVIDGSADPEFKMEDLGNAVRKIHIDLGVPIDFVSAFAIRKGKEPANRHCAVAEIQYGCVDTVIGPDGKEQEAKSGCLVYIKTSMNGNEPADVLQYAATHPDFPHESTANQFFNESQFETYVRLGSHVVHEIVEPKPDSPLHKPLTAQDFAEAAKKHAGEPSHASSWLGRLLKIFN